MPAQRLPVVRPCDLVPEIFISSQDAAKLTLLYCMRQEKPQSMLLCTSLVHPPSPPVYSNLSGKNYMFFMHKQMVLVALMLSI